jgi:hypothetical protein
MKHNPKLPPLKISDKTRVATKADGTQLPVLDGKWTFILEPNEEDIKNGVPGDRTRCMYCLACKRMYGCDLVWVTRTRAYIELRGKGGRLELRRFVLKDPAQMQVKDFDREDVTPEVVIFVKPTGRESLNGIRARYRQSKLQPNSRRLPSSHRVSVTDTRVKGKAPRKAQKPHEIDSFRTLRAAGTGMFQFPRGQKTIA